MILNEKKKIAVKEKYFNISQRYYYKLFVLRDTLAIFAYSFISEH